VSGVSGVRLSEGKKQQTRRLLDLKGLASFPTTKKKIRRRKNHYLLRYSWTRKRRRQHTQEEEEEESIFPSHATNTQERRACE